MGTSGPQQVLERLHAAINAHDLEAFTANFDPGYRSEQPAHPDRAFTGSDQVRENWRAMFAGVPDFHADVIASAIAGDTLWTEWRWTGTPQDGSELDVRGVTLFGVEEDRITWARLYVEQVEHAGAGIEGAVRDLSGAQPARAR